MADQSLASVSAEERAGKLPCRTLWRTGSVPLQFVDMQGNGLARSSQTQLTFDGCIHMYALMLPEILQLSARALQPIPGLRITRCWRKPLPSIFFSFPARHNTEYTYLHVWPTCKHASGAPYGYAHMHTHTTQLACGLQPRSRGEASIRGDWFM